jgi:hypothetical protein
MARRSSSFPGHLTPPRVCALIIVAREQEDLRQALGRTVGSCATVQIVRDRRNGERRRGDQRPAAERRYGDRRHVPARAEDPELRQYVVARPWDRAPRD